jgi:hypothetical protein
MKETLEQFGEWWKEKTTSPIYFTYFFYVVLWNWKLFHVLFVEDASKFSVPRIEYVQQMYTFVDNLPLYPSLVPFVSFIWHFIPPIIFTWLTIAYLPIVYRWALGLHIENKFEHRRQYQREKLKYEEWLLKQQETISEVTTKRAEQVKVEKEQKEIINKTITEREKNILEYKEFKKSSLFKKFQQIKKSIYSYNGRTTPWINGEDVRIVDESILAIAHAKELIEITRDSNNNEVIKLTPKGLIFMDLYLADNF